MIKEVNLTKEQCEYLEHLLEDWLESENISPTGLEVTGLQIEEPGIYKVFYNYEKVDKHGKSRFMNTSSYIASPYQTIEEVRFDKRGHKI